MKKSISAFIIFCQIWLPLALAAQTNIRANNGTFTGNVSVAGALSTGLRERDCRADGVIDITGAADASAVINTCIANAKTNKQTHVLLPCGNILLTATTLNGTNFPGIHISGCGWEGDATNPPTQSQGITNLWCNQGATKICLDLTGSSSHEIDHLDMTLFKSGLTGVGMGILQGRDNSGGGGAANPLCFSEMFNIHDVYITDNGASSLTLNSNRGFVGIYNVSAENGVYNNINILADTPMVFSQNNVLGTASPYQTLQTGCPLSMTGVVMENPVLGGSSTTLPIIEANTTEGFRITGIQGVNGAALIKFENTAGASPTDSWTVTGLYEQGASDIINAVVNLDNMDIYVLIAVPPPGFDIKMGANNLSITQSRLIFDSTPAIVPLIDNVSTGTTISGSTINIGGATSASNTVVTSSTVYAQGLTDAQITFGTGSNYDRFTSTGISTVGTRKATQFVATSNGTLAAPALGVTSNSGFFLSSNTILQMTYGGTASAGFTAGQFINPVAMVDCWSSNADPNNAACDTGVSRAAAKIVYVGNGTAADKTGILQSGNTVRVASDFTTANNTNLQTITGLSWTFPALAANYSFHCSLSYSQSTAAVSDAFGIQAATNAPTNIFANGKVWTAAAVVTTGTLATLTTTTATNILTFTPGATATNNVAELDGTFELPASANTINIMVSTTAGADAIIVRRGSYCQLF